jgi:hypothetical protein
LAGPVNLAAFQQRKSTAARAMLIAELLLQSLFLLGGQLAQVQAGDF